MADEITTEEVKTEVAQPANAFDFEAWKTEPTILAPVEETKAEVVEAEKAVVEEKPVVVEEKKSEPAAPERR